MGLYVADPVTGLLHGEAPELDRKLREGDGLIWRGDPRLSLHMGVMTAKRGGYDEKVKRSVRRGEIVARRYEVHRHNEDGTETIIGHWLLEEFDRILLDLVAMDPRTPGHVPVDERLTKAEEAQDKAIGEAIRESVGPAIEHAMHLAHDRHNPGHTFRGIPGLRDERNTTESPVSERNTAE